MLEIWVSNLVDRVNNQVTLSNITDPQLWKDIPFLDCSVAIANVKRFQGCWSSRMKLEQEHCVWQVIIVRPNHSCCLSLLRFYPLITSAPPGGLCLAHTACSSWQDLAGFSFANPLLYIWCIWVSQVQTLYLLAPCGHKKTPTGCNSNPAAALLCSLVTGCSFLVAAAHISNTRLHWGSGVLQSGFHLRFEIYLLFLILKCLKS